MKIIELRFQNLNSLYGEWRIDFSHPDYLNNGIFALTGPTGAGKSTILDAICLALYGATPRLGRVNKTSNELMSRHCGECYAELVFESKAGRYRCRWEQRRARKAPDGKLQDHRHEIGEADTKKLLESKRSAVLEVIEQKTGMDFERFTRSILLAQGGFDNFLKADVEQKSKILEQITGTEIYTVISRQVHERCREEKERLQHLVAETAGIVLLEPEQVQALQQQRVSLQQRQRALSEQCQQSQQAIAWRENIAQLDRELVQVNAELGDLEKQQHAFRPRQAQLDNALKAAALEGHYAQLEALRKQLSHDGKACSELQLQEPALQAAYKEEQQGLQRAEEHSECAKRALKSASAVFQQVRSLDQQLQQQLESMGQQQQVCSAEQKRIQAVQRELSAYQETLASQQEAWQRAQAYLQAHAQDRQLVSGLAAIESLNTHVLTQQQQAQQLQEAVQRAQQSASQCQQQAELGAAQIVADKRVLAGASEQRAVAEQGLQQALAGRLLREYRAEKDALFREMSLVKLIHGFESHRQKLEDGKACPLCGALQHPFAEGNLPAADELEQRIAQLSGFIDDAEQREQAVAALQQAELQAKNALDRSEQQQILLSDKQHSQQQLLVECRGRLERHNEELELSSAQLLEKLQGFGGDCAEHREPHQSLPMLRQRLQTWQQQQDVKTETETQRLLTQNDIARCQATLESQQQALQTRLQDLEQLTRQYNECKQQRSEVFAAKDPQREEQALQQVISEAEQLEKLQRQKCQDNQQQLTAARSKLESLQQRIAQATQEQTIVHEAFVSELNLSDFDSEAAFCAARLDRQTRQQLSQAANALHHRHTELTAKQRERRERLRTEQAKQLSELNLEALTQKHGEQSRQLSHINQELAGLNHRLEQHQQAAERIEKKQQHISAQKEECQRWEKLHLLIGSADGKKYRNFAQGLTFELMINHANRQLQKMSDRYLLAQHDSQALELSVIDNYQAGEARPTKNLSGGESFIVSLSLALGLSNMSSRKVRVDSLFLDEGFGTLDEDALDTALDMLSSLHQEGKVIGVISHISQLKERIATQVKVEPVGGGKSQLFGAGCSGCA